MRIIVDTREQQPLTFHPDGILTDVIRTKLDVGDYGAEYIDGSRCPIYFERKSLGDLFGTLTTGYKRFNAELLRAQELNVRLILVVEGSITDILHGSAYSQVDGIVIVKQLMTLWLKYDLTPMFFTSRSEMSLAIREFYSSFGRNYKKKLPKEILNDETTDPSTTLRKNPHPTAYPVPLDKPEANPLYQDASEDII